MFATLPLLAFRLPSVQHSAMRARVIEQELLEIYPEDHPDAICGREDLLLVNAVMGNHRWMERMLRRWHQPGWRITEIGAGDGALSLRLKEQGICAAKDLRAFDLAARPARWPSAARGATRAGQAGGGRQVHQPQRPAGAVRVPAAPRAAAAPVRGSVTA